MNVAQGKPMESGGPNDCREVREWFSRHAGAIVENRAIGNRTANTNRLHWCNERQFRQAHLRINGWPDDVITGLWKKMVDSAMVPHGSPTAPEYPVLEPACTEVTGYTDNSVTLTGSKEVNLTSAEDVNTAIEAMEISARDMAGTLNGQFETAGLSSFSGSITTSHIQSMGPMLESVKNKGSANFNTLNAFQAPSYQVKENTDEERAFPDAIDGATGDSTSRIITISRAINGVCNKVILVDVTAQVKTHADIVRQSDLFADMMYPIKYIYYVCHLIRNYKYNGLIYVERNNAKTFQPVGCEPRNLTQFSKMKYNAVHSHAHIDIFMICM